MVKSGTDKPPLAPKPKLARQQPTAASPSAPGKEVASRRSPGPPRKMRPLLAPKPDLAELNSKAASSKARATNAAKSPSPVGLLKPQNGVGNDDKKPTWDDVLPICLRSPKNYRRIRDAHVDPKESRFPSGHPKRGVAPAVATDGHLASPKPPRDPSPSSAENLRQNASASPPPVRVGQLVLRGSGRHRANENASERCPEEDADEAGRKNPPAPVPVPRRHKNTSLACQEKGEEIPAREGSNGKGGSAGGQSRAWPAPTPRTKPHLAPAERGSGPARPALRSEADEEDLGYDDPADPTELSVDEEPAGGRRDGQASNNGGFPSDRHGATTPPANDSATAWTKKTATAEVGEALPSAAGVTNPSSGVAERPPPPGKTARRHESGPALPRRHSSFSGMELLRPEGRRSSFRKLLDLKLSAAARPKGSPTPAPDERDGPRRPRAAPPQRFSPPFGAEQSVDGEESEANYENICYYEEISHYENFYFAGSDASDATWQSFDDDDGIYEEPEVYLSPDKKSDDDRSSLSEEADDGNSDDDLLPAFSDEEDESSLSSKGDAEQAETASGPAKRKIHHIATEMMTSEKAFVDVLKLLHVDFRDAVAKASRENGKAVIEERALERILYYLPQLYELNRDLLQELSNRLDKWDENQQVADIFLKVGPYLKMYSTYIREFDKNVALLEEHSRKNAPFAAVVRQFEAGPRCANLALKHYLLKPVQRIPQYRLLLRDYLRNLSKDSADYKDTQDALAIVEEVAEHANDIMKQGDNFQKLMQVQGSLNGHREIVQPGRIFLKEGVLNKLSRKVMQPRMFFLFNDSLLYTTPLQSGQYKFNNLLSLAGMKVSRPSQEACQNEFIVESVERSFILSASSASERDEWLRAISAAIGDHTKKKITFISGKSFDEVQPSNGDSLGTKAPIWIPDPRATMCMICTCEFTLTWRRHHCRACGKVVCQSCSSNKRSLEYLKNQLARVCDQCYLVLREQEHQSQEDPSEAALPKASFAFARKHKRIPAALKEVSANTDNPSMSGYLQRSKGKKKQGKRLWFVIKDKVLYTYAAMEDVAAVESQPLLGLVLKVDSSQKSQFKLYHKNTLYYNFKADDVQTAQRWINTFRESAIL
ncbi:FYVE, RhoGEF and PH domain-containing protein 6-like [Hippocampus zosterae]|uniref:FYVE, RhoGEF and PH domain-containing protein 6-like n=1 Tax=Hippocampus zosterae TaxID=109293 RepID=UPI00223C95E7|nr:FYVE, RhoGEF and PH domain-containing protein 6-like [Hippocampus zosterae]